MLGAAKDTAPSVGALLTREDLAKGFRALGLSGADTVLAQSSFKAFGGVSGGPKTVIEALLEVLGPDGTLAMPTFNWDDFGGKKLYSKRHTKPQTGVLCEMLMDWPGAYRIYHPIHGFTLVGRRAKELSEKVKNESSFEASSLFGELHRSNAKIMLMGVNYRKGLTFFHYVEEAANVPYRKFIELKGSVEELDGSVHEISMNYFGRRTKDVKYDIDKVQPFLETSENPVVRVGRIGGSAVKVMHARDVYERIMHALMQNPNLAVVPEWPEGFFQPPKNQKDKQKENHEERGKT